MDAYSLDLRQRICAACDERTDTRGEVAERFGVSRWFVQKLLRQRRRDGSIAAKARGRGPAPAIGAADAQLLRGLVKADPDATLAELCDSMCRALKGLRLVLKKRRCTPASGTRRGSGRCAGTSGGGWRRWTPRGWSSWTRAGSTPR